MLRLLEDMEITGLDINHCGNTSEISDSMRINNICNNNEIYNNQSINQDSNLFNLNDNNNNALMIEKHTNNRFTKEEDDFIYEIANKWKSDNRGRGLWTFIAEILGRNDSCISTRYRMIEKALNSENGFQLSSRSINSNPNDNVSYTAEDDMLIKNSIIEWKNQNKLSGLWSHLSKLMNRNPSSLYRRYEALEADDSSITIYQSHKGKIKHVLDPSRNGRKFTKEEDEYILNIVSKWKLENRGRGMWIYIGKELNRNDSSISTRYELLLKIIAGSRDDHSNKLIGRKFNNEEDERLKELVNEWKVLGKGKGIWAHIAKEMNRKENSIIARYKNIMKTEET